jgi:hypothetical protein
MVSQFIILLKRFYGVCVTIDRVWIGEWFFFYYYLVWTTLKHHSTVACMFVSAGMCLLSRCPETAMGIFACCIATGVLVSFEVSG